MSTILEVIAAFARNETRAASFTGVIIPGALHGFRKHESVLAREIVRWVRRVEGY